MGNLPPLNLVDIIAVVMIGLGALRGYFRGLSGEFARLVGLLAAFAVGVLFHAPVGTWIRDVTRLSGPAAMATAYLLLVVVAVTVMAIVGSLLKRLIQVVIARRLDRNLGLVMGAAKSAVLVAIIVLAAQLWPTEACQRHFLTESAVGTLLHSAMPSVRKALEDVELVAPPPIPGDDGAPATDDNENPARRPTRDRAPREPKVERV